MNEIYKARLGLIPALSERHTNGHIGRTALMKYMYFLQTLRDVPLGYHFSMYSYGPFDPDVLSDLSLAEAMDFVSSTPVTFSGGYGYEIRAKENAGKIRQEIGQFVDHHKSDIDWLFEQFGRLNSVELELASTIVFVDREFSDEHKNHQKSEILTRIKEIKPHFSQEQIQESFNSLFSKGLITSTGAKT